MYIVYIFSLYTLYTFLLHPVSTQTFPKIGHLTAIAEPSSRRLGDNPPGRGAAVEMVMRLENSLI